MKNPASAVTLLMWVTLGFFTLGQPTLAAEQWREGNFPAPNGGKLVFAVMGSGNPACASYDGANCLWGRSVGDIDFTKVVPLVCGEAHRRAYGVTGYEDGKHWCSLARHAGAGQGGGAPSAPPATGYRTTGWSSWGRAAGVEYRYRIGWDPSTGGSGKTVEAIYEVRNPGRKHWSGAARSINCSPNTLWGSADAEVPAGQTREIRVRAPNCGDAQHPAVRPDVVRAGRFD